MKKTMLFTPLTLSQRLIGLLCLCLLFACNPKKIISEMITPNEDFDASRLAPAPDYSRARYWASLPDKKDLGDLRPQGIGPKDSLLQKADVFYLHPTTYYRGKYWNEPLDSLSGTAKNTRWNMANNASIFNDARLYAPLYRQAAIICFTDMEAPNPQKALEVAYQDAERAFAIFLKDYNQGRPFFIAGHSQGAYLGWRLLQEKIAGTPLAEKMVAAYLLGTTHITNENVKVLEGIAVCDAPEQYGCLIGFNTFADGLKDPDALGLAGTVCVNPLSWQRDGGLAPKALHRGYVTENGKQTVRIVGKDKPNSVGFGALEAPQAQLVHARCEQGALFVKALDLGREIDKGNYHGIEMQLFHMDIRHNMKVRMLSYLKQ